jgi:hypothetical protein
MPVSNTSYLSSTSDLFVYEEERFILQMLTEDDTDDPTDGSFLSSGILDRLTTMMNWGREKIDSLLLGIYPIDGWDATNCPKIVKSWNARYVVARLESRRLVRAESPREAENVIDQEIMEYTRPDGVRILPGGKTAQTTFEHVVRDRTYKSDFAEQFDDLDYQVSDNNDA